MYSNVATLPFGDLGFMCGFYVLEELVGAPKLVTNRYNELCGKTIISDRGAEMRLHTVLEQRRCPKRSTFWLNKNLPAWGRKNFSSVVTGLLLLV